MIIIVNNKNNKRKGKEGLNKGWKERERKDGRSVKGRMDERISAMAPQVLLEQRFGVMGADVLRRNICTRFNICASYEQ